MGSLIGWLIAKGLSPKLARAAAIGGLFLLIISVLAGAKCAYDASVIERHVTKQESKQVRRERAADRNLEDQKRLDEAAKADRQKEIDDATRNIADQAPSPRQRVRACVELRRQARAQGRVEPAC